MGESHFIHGLIRVYVLVLMLHMHLKWFKYALLCTWAHYGMYFHPVTSGVLKGVLMEMAVCSTAFNSLCVYIQWDSIECSCLFLFLLKECCISFVSERLGLPECSVKFSVSTTPHY